MESINFYLLHLCLLREFLDLEFRDIETTLSFEYSLERIIDDFILLAVFVGNDFLPNLPDLHIHENGLERLFDVYKTVLPRLSEFFFPFIVVFLFCFVLGMLLRKPFLFVF